MSLFNRFKEKSVPRPATEADMHDRYTLEHIFLPQNVLADHGADVIRKILRKKGRFFVDFFRQNNSFGTDNYTCPYTEEQFSVEKIHFDRAENICLIRIQMPEPERQPLCKSIFICCDRRMNDRRYLTEELTSSNRYFLCEWADGVHRVYDWFSEEKLLKSVKGSKKS